MRSQQLGRFQHQVVGTGAQAGIVATKRDLGICSVGELEAIRQVDALHHHRQFMKAIVEKKQHAMKHRT